ncbi:MAG: MipA/OmpV family protein [Erythrobacter sp.]|nr:MAG: MipA/OmpV family protein [Erythrobacter sp.]
MRIRQLAAYAAVSSFALSAPALAQQAPEGPPVDMEDSVFAGDYLSVGVGAALNPSYTGSDDYVVTVLPILQGSLGGVGISPRAGGVTLDFIPDATEGVSFDAGIAARVRGNRANQIKDDVVIQYGELDTAIEVGPSVGFSVPQVLNPYDSLSFGTDVMFDVAGAHGGMTVSPSVSYFTPLSRSIVASLSLGAEWADEDFQDYYFRSDPADYIGAGPAPLAPYEPDGGGFTSMGVNLLLGVDLDGDVTNGGLGLVVITGYSRLLGDAANNPFTTVRGSRDQFLGAVGVGYTF